MANATIATYPGRTIFNNRLKGSGTEPKNIAWGDTPVTGSANSNVNLFRPQSEARTAGTSVLLSAQFLGDAYQVSGLITCTGGSKTITECGLFDTTTVSPTTSITAALTAGATTVSLASVAGLPTAGRYYAQLASLTTFETILVSGSGASPLTIARAKLGSTAQALILGTNFTIGDDGGAAVTGGTNTEQTATVGSGSGGAMFTHADFAGIALNVNDGINFTWQVTLT